MRTSEKILLGFITIGILFFGSYISWRYYEQSKANISTSTAEKVNTGFVQPDGDNDLSVRDTPYYNSIIRRKGANENNDQAGSAKGDTDNGWPLENTDNQNSNQTGGLAPTASANVNSAGFEKTSYAGNNNQNSANSNDNSAKPFSFAIIGDSQGFKADDSTDSLKTAVANITQANPDLVMTEGDLISSCDGSDKCAQKYDSWKKVVQPILNKTMEMQGNHDRVGKDAADKIWQNEFDLPTNGPSGYSELVYSFDYSNSHFVVLDSEKPSEHIIGQDQRDWLEKDLAATQKDNIFVFFHEPAYPVSSKIDESLDAKPADRDALWTILKNHRVTAVFSGHEHIMSRKAVDGIYQFVIGNTDAFDHDLPKSGMADYSYKGHHYAIVSVNGKQVTVNGYKTDGTQLNSFVIPQ